MANGETIALRAEPVGYREEAVSKLSPTKLNPRRLMGYCPSSVALPDQSERTA